MAAYVCAEKGAASMIEAEFKEPTCDKCGAPITTGLMAVFCPAGKECEFWVPEVEQFRKDWGNPEVPA